jgi:hypothetical protein
VQHRNTGRLIVEEVDDDGVPVQRLRHEEPAYPRLDITGTL